MTTAPGAVTAQERASTNAGITALNEGVADCTRHLNVLDTTVVTLRAGGWSGDASRAFQSVMDAWMTDFNTMKVRLDEMRGALELTLVGLTNNEHENTQLTLGILNQMSPVR